jgi:NitT/TauT family transport system permease protein
MSNDQEASVSNIELNSQYTGTLGGAVLRHTLIFFVIMFIWEMANRTGFSNPLLLPRPTDVVASIWKIYVTQGNVWYHLWVTFQEAMLGCFVGTVIGIALAVAAVLSDTFRQFLKPYIIIVEATPRIAVGPIFVTWFGFGMSSKVALAALVCFFAPFVNTITGLLGVQEESYELFRSLGATRRQVFWRLMIPTALPTMNAGLKLAVGSAFGGALVAEFISAQAGMGILMARYTMSLNMPSAFAGLLSITLYGFLLFRTMEVIDRRVLYWLDDDLMAKKSAKRAIKYRQELGL